MAANASVQRYADDLAEALARARAAGAQAVDEEAAGLRSQLLSDLGQDDMAGFITPHVRVVNAFNQIRVTVRIDGVQAAADAHAKAGKPIDPNFDLALEREFGSHNVTPHPFFYSTVRANTNRIRTRIANAIFNALFDSASEVDVHNPGTLGNPTFEAGDEGHNANVTLG